MGEKDIDATNLALLEVFMQSKDATAIYQGQDLQIVFANDAMLKFWAKERTIIGLPLIEAVPELRGQSFEQILKEVWQSGQTYEAKDVPAELIVNGELQTRYFDFTYKAILTADGQVQYIFHTAIEVSDRMLAWNLVREKDAREQEMLLDLQLKHDSLTDTENRLHQLVLSAPVAMTILRGRDFIIEMPNDKILQIWGRTKELVVGRKLLDVFPELVGQPFPEMLSGVLETGKPVRIKEIPVTITGTDGISRSIFVNFAYEPLFASDGTVDSVMASVFDITEIVDSRKALEEKELELQQLNEALAATNEEYLAANEELAALNEEYTSVNEELQTTNEELQTAVEELNALNEEYTAVNEELKVTNDHVYDLSEKLKAANDGLLLDNVDLTSQRDELTLSLRTLFGLFVDAPVAIGLLKGKNFLIEYANPELLKLWGKNQDVLEKPLVEVVPELEGQPFFEILDHVLSTGLVYVGNGQKATLLYDGELRDFYFDFTYKPLKDHSGVWDSVLVVANDVTGQVKSRRVVEDSLERLRYALEVGHLGSYELSLKDDRSITSNSYFKMHFGFASDDAFTFDDLFRAILPEYREAVDRGIREAIDHKGLFEGEYQVLWANGSRHWIKASGRATYDAKGNPLKIVGVTADVTEQKAFDQRKDDFLSIASHELKTPVTTLKANLQLLARLKEKLENPMAAKLIDNSVRTTEKLNIMIGDLLDINRFSEGQVKLNKVPFAIKDLLNGCCGHIRLDNKHELVVSGDEVTLTGDESRIEQVISNFVDNAVKYAPDSEKIYLSAVKTGDFVKVSVRDNGPGISPEQVNSLFDRYWRADHSSRDYTGLGLGLFICAEIVRKHGGEIGVESEMGKGATFWFTLPI